MSESFTRMKQVSPELLKERVETIKDLVENDMEFYEIIRDRETEDHYLHYAYLHLNIAEGGAREVYHHLLPLNSSDVLAIMYGEQAYSYPEHWDRAYLRSGPDGNLVWFDTPQVDDTEGEAIGHKLQDKLAKFQEKGSLDDESLKKLFAEIEKMIEKE